MDSTSCDYFRWETTACYDGVFVGNVPDSLRNSLETFIVWKFCLVMIGVSVWLYTVSVG